MLVVYLVVRRQRSIIFIVVVRVDGLDLKFDTEVVTVRVRGCNRDL